MRKVLYLLTIFICTSLKTVAQTIENPVFDRTDVPAFHIDKVSINKDATIIQCSYTAEANSWANISEDTYLLDTKTNKKYPIQKSEGLPYGPEQRKFLFGERCEVILYFPSFNPQGKLDLIENKDEKAFNIYGICLFDNLEKKYQLTDLNRFSNMSSFYDSASDTLNAIYYKNEEIGASKYIYGIMSDAVLCSSLGLCLLYDKYGFHHEIDSIVNSLSQLQEELIGNYDLEYIFLHRTFASFYSISYNYENAIKTFKDAIILYDKLNIVDNVYALLLRYVANDYSILGDEKSFLLLQKQSMEVRRKLGVGNSYLEELLITLLRNVKPYLYDGRLDVIEEEIVKIPCFIDTLSIDYAYFLSYLAPMYKDIGKPQKSISISDQVLSILRNNDGNTDKEVEVQEIKLNCLKELRRWHEVILLGENIIRKCDSIQIKPKAYRPILYDLADSYCNLYDYEKAIPILDKLITIYEEDGNWLELTLALCTNGNYCKNKGDLDKAERYMLKALEVINQHDRVEEYLKKEIENDNNASEILNETIAYYRDKILGIKATLYGSLGFVQSHKGNLEDAIESELKAGEVMKVQMGYNVDNVVFYNLDGKVYAYHLLSLSDYYAETGQYEKSNNCAKESINYFKNGGGHDFYRSYLRLAINSFLEKDIESAIHYANEALLISNYSTNKEDKNKCLCFLAEFYSLKKDFKIAEEKLSEAINYTQGTIMKEIVNMTNEQKQRLWNINESLFIRYRNVVSKCNLDGYLISKLLNYTLFSKSLLLDTDNSNIEQITNRMSINWKDIQTALSDNDIAIEFISIQEESNSDYYALTIDKNSDKPGMFYLFCDSDYKLISDFKVYGDIIWKPILSHYSNVENIYFSPDGIINQLPIEYCYVDGVGEMMEHFNIFRLSSTKEVVFRNKKVQETNAILYGGLNYETQVIEASANDSIRGNSFLRSINARGGFDPLYSALEEVLEIDLLLRNKNISTTLFTDEKGTENSFKKLSGRDVKMIHLSTHGMYVGPDSVAQIKINNNFAFLELIRNEKDPVKEDIVLTHSFLVMSGGNKLLYRKAISPQVDDDILTAFEISQLDLRKVDMVVLSACETGLGDINYNGVYGLQRGFKKAGVNTILMSLDKVDDEATKLLMVEFYKNLMDGKSKRQSLKDAQKYLRQVDNGKYDKPEYWASFILLDGIN